MYTTNDTALLLGLQAYFATHKNILPLGTFFKLLAPSNAINQNE